MPTLEQAGRLEAQIYETADRRMEADGRLSRKQALIEAAAWIAPNWEYVTCEAIGAPTALKLVRYVG